MLASYLLDVSKVNVCFIRLNSISQKSKRCVHIIGLDAVKNLQNKLQFSRLPVNHYSLCCPICHELSEVRSWKLNGSNVEALPLRSGSKKTPSVAVVRYFRSNLRPGVATLYPTKHKCLPKKITDSKQITVPNEIPKERGTVSANKIKSEMRKLAFKIKKDQWSRKAAEITKIEETVDRKIDPNFPAPKFVGKTWGQNDNKVMFESKSLKELKQRITRKKPKEPAPIPPIPIGIKLPASSENASQTLGASSKFLIVSDSKDKRQDSSTESKDFSLPSPYFFIHQALNKEFLKGTFSDPSSIKINKSKKEQDKSKDTKTETLSSHTPSPRLLLTSGKENVGTDVLRRKVVSAFKHAIPQHGAQDLIGSLILAKEEEIKSQPEVRNSDYPCPNMKRSNTFFWSQELSPSNSHMWPDEVALTSSGSANLTKQKSKSAMSLGYDDYLRKSDSDIRRKRLAKRASKEIVLYKDDKVRQDLSKQQLIPPSTNLNKLTPLKETTQSESSDQPKQAFNDLKKVNNLSLTKENISKHKSNSIVPGLNSVSGGMTNHCNSFSNVAMEKQATNISNNIKVPMADKSSNSISPILSKEMHSGSSNNDGRKERDSDGEWELQVHSGSNLGPKSDFRHHQRDGNYVVAEEGLPSGKKVLHLYSKRIIQVTSPEGYHANLNESDDPEKKYPTEETKSHQPLVKILKKPESSRNDGIPKTFTDLYEDIDLKSINRETSGRRLLLGKQPHQVLQSDDSIQKPSHAEPEQINERNTYENYPENLQETLEVQSSHRNSLQSNYGDTQTKNYDNDFSPEGSTVEASSKVDQTYQYRKNTESDYATNDLKSDLPEKSDKIDKRVPYKPPNSDQYELVNPREPVHGQFTPYFPSPKTRPFAPDKPAPNNEQDAQIHHHSPERQITTNFDRKLRDLAAPYKKNHMTPSVSPSENEHDQRRNIKSNSRKLMEGNGENKYSSDAASKSRNKEIPDKHFSDRIYLKVIDQNQQSRSTNDTIVDEIPDVSTFNRISNKLSDHSGETYNARAKEGKTEPSKTQPEERGHIFQSQALGSNFSPNSDYLDIEFQKRVKQPSEMSYKINRFIGEPEVKDSAREYKESKINNDTYVKVNVSPGRQLSLNPRSSQQSPHSLFADGIRKRNEYPNESNSSTVESSDEKLQARLSDSNRIVNDKAKDELPPFEVSNAIRENVQRDRDVTIESEVRQKFDSQAFEYTLAEESKRSFEELKKLVNEELKVNENAHKKQHTFRDGSGSPLVSEGSFSKRVNETSKSKQSFKPLNINDTVLSTSNQKSDAEESSSASKNPRKNLRNSYYHIGKAKSCLETFLENVDLEPRFFNDSQNSVTVRKNYEYYESQSSPKFEYHSQKKIEREQPHRRSKVNSNSLTEREKFEYYSQKHNERTQPPRQSKINPNSFNEGEKFEYYSPKVNERTPSTRQNTVNENSLNNGNKVALNTLLNSEKRSARSIIETKVKPFISKTQVHPFDSNFERNIEKNIKLSKKAKPKKNVDAETVEQFQVWDASAINKAVPKLHQKRSDWYNHFKNRKGSHTEFSNVEPNTVNNPPYQSAPSRSDSFQNSSPYDISLFYSQQPSRAANYAQTSGKSNSFSGSQPQPHYKEQNLKTTLRDEALRAHKYAIDYYNDYYSKPNATGAIDSIPPNLLSDSNLYSVEDPKYAYSRNYGQFSQVNSNSNTNQNKKSYKMSSGLTPPSPHLNNIVGRNLDQTKEGNDVYRQNSNYNIPVNDSNHNYWLNQQTNISNSNVSEHYSDNNLKTEALKTELEANINTINSYTPHRHDASANITRADFSHDFRLPAAKLNSENRDSYYQNHLQENFSNIYPNLHYQNRHMIPPSSASAEGHQNYAPDSYKRTSILGEQTGGNNSDVTFPNKKDNKEDPYNESSRDETEVSVKYSPSGLRIYEREHRPLTSQGAHINARRMKSPDIYENTNITTSADRNYTSAKGKMFNAREKSAMNNSHHSRNKHTTSDSAGNDRESFITDPPPPEFVHSLNEDFKKGFSLLDLPKNISGYIHKLVNWKNTKSYNYGDNEFSQDDVDYYRNKSKRKPPALAEIPSPIKENTLEKFTKPIIETINRNVDSYYVKSVFVDNPMKSISKVAFARRLSAKLGSGVDGEEGNCTTCMKLSKLSSSIQNGVPFLKSKKLNYSFRKGYISSNGNCSNEENEGNPIIEENNQNQMHENTHKYMQGNHLKSSEPPKEKATKMSFMPPKPKFPAALYINEDMKPDEVSYLNPYVNYKSKGNFSNNRSAITKLKAITGGKFKGTESKQVKSPEKKLSIKSNILNAKITVSNKLKSVVGKPKLATKPIEETGSRQVAVNKKLSDINEGISAKPVKNDSYSNSGSTQLVDDIPKEKSTIKAKPQDPTNAENKLVVKIVKKPAQSVRKSLSSAMSKGGKTVALKSKKANNPVKNDSASVKERKSKGDQSVDIVNVVKPSSEKSGNKSLVDVKKYLSDRKNNPYRAFSDLYSN